MNEKEFSELTDEQKKALFSFLENLEMCPNDHMKKKGKACIQCEIVKFSQMVKDADNEKFQCPECGERKSVFFYSAWEEHNQEVVYWGQCVFCKRMTVSRNDTDAVRKDWSQ